MCFSHSITYIQVTANLCRWFRLPGSRVVAVSSPSTSASMPWTPRKVINPINSVMVLRWLLRNKCARNNACAYYSELPSNISTINSIQILNLLNTISENFDNRLGQTASVSVVKYHVIWTKKRRSLLPQILIIEGLIYEY